MKSAVSLYKPISIICFLTLIICLFSECDSGVRKKQKTIVKSDGFYVSNKKFKSFSRQYLHEASAFLPHDFNGCILMYKDGKIYRKAIGYRDLQRREKMDETDVFQLASVSKTVTAVAVMMLVQQKRIALDSMVGKYLNDFPYSGITVRQLLNHRSGLANYMYSTDTFWKDTSVCMSNKDFCHYMKTARPAVYTPPGISFSYCNTNFAYLAVLVSEVSDTPFHKFVEERIFKPAGMRNSFFHGYKSPRIKSRVLTGRYDQYEYKGTYYMDGILGDKSLYSNIDDLLSFHLALSEGRLLKPEYLGMMQEASYEHNVYGGSYGLGFRLMKTHSGQWTYHNGWWRGFWTSFWNRFDKKTCLIILTNNKRSSKVDKQGLAELLLDKG